VGARAGSSVTDQIIHSLNRELEWANPTIWELVLGTLIQWVYRPTSQTRLESSKTSMAMTAWAALTNRPSVLGTNIVPGAGAVVATSAYSRREA
jgi:hypothetical protein